MNRALSVVAGLLCFNPLLLTTGRAQVAPRIPSTQSGGQETQRLPATDSANDAFSSPQLPHTQIEHDSGPPYGSVFYDVGVGQRLEPRAGGFSASLPNIFQAGFRYDAPFLNARGGSTNAEIKLGRLYYDVTALSTSWLFSDNVNRVETGGSSGFIGICTLKGIAMLQLLENLRIAATAELVLLPLRGKFGLAGFVRDSGEARLFLSDSQGRERLRAQVAYDLLVGGWNVMIYDQVRMKSPSALFDERFNIAAGEPFDEQDRAGRYAFRSSTGGSGLRVNEYDRSSNQSFDYVNNQMGVSASRLLPTETRATFGAYRMDYWYLGDKGAILPRTREVGYASLNSERDNLRFKPFISYQIYRSNEREWKQEVRGGIHGPITDYLQFSSSFGYYIGGRMNRDAYLAHAKLQHDINPLTRQSIEYRRDITAPEEDLEESYTYHLRRVIGPYLNASLFFTYATFEDLNNNNTGTTEMRGGLLFDSHITSKAYLRFGAIYSRVEYNNTAFGEWDRWSALAQLHYRFSESFFAALTYRYQTRKSTVAGDSFDENLVMLTVTKRFDAPQRGVDVTEE